MDDIKITDSPYYICERCNKWFSSRSSLELHNKIHKDYVCARCLKKFNQKCSLASHMRSSSCKEFFACEFCEKTFKDQNELKCHLITHKEARKNTCHVCKKAFRYKHVLTIHRNVCHPNEKLFTCDFCDEAFKSKNEFKIHFKEHEKEFKSNSDICEKSFMNGDIKIHSCKTDKKPYVCNICQKTFTVKSKLTRHALQHISNGRCKKQRSSVDSLEK